MKWFFDLVFGQESSGFGLTFLQTTDRPSLYDGPSVVHKLHYAAPDFGSVSVAFVHDGPSAVKRRTVRRIGFAGARIWSAWCCYCPSIFDGPSVVLTDSQQYGT